MATGANIPALAKFSFHFHIYSSLEFIQLFIGNNISISPYTMRSNRAARNASITGEREKKLPYVPQLIRTNSWHVTRIYAFILNCIRITYRIGGFYRCVYKMKQRHLFLRGTFSFRALFHYNVESLRWSFRFESLHTSNLCTIYWMKLQPCLTFFLTYIRLICTAMTWKTSHLWKYERFAGVVFLFVHCEQNSR